VPEKDGQALLFTVRGKEPGKGLLDMPGGFVDLGESIVEGLHRELREELGWVPPGENLYGIFRFFASFPNVYAYKGINYNTCDMYFSVSAPGLIMEDLHIEHSEITEVRFLKPQEIDFDQFAFESTRRAVKVYLSELD
jgi:ADP-ribose pyrophosphatase YjhB (NUDIX family)